MDATRRFLTNIQIADHWGEIWRAVHLLKFQDESTTVVALIDAVEGYVTANLAGALARAGTQGEPGGPGE